MHKYQAGSAVVRMLTAIAIEGESSVRILCSRKADGGLGFTSSTLQKVVERGLVDIECVDGSETVTHISNEALLILVRSVVPAYLK